MHTIWRGTITELHLATIAPLVGDSGPAVGQAKPPEDPGRPTTSGVNNTKVASSPAGIDFAFCGNF
jgi:hypothetical protein